MALLTHLGETPADGLAYLGTLRSHIFCIPSLSLYSFTLTVLGVAQTLGVLPEFLSEKLWPSIISLRHLCFTADIP